MSTCGTCKYWQSPDPSEVRYGVCQRIPGWSSEDHGGPVAKWDDDVCDVVPDKDALPASVADGSGYHAALRCRNDFGCSLWEK